MTDAAIVDHKMVIFLKIQNSPFLLGQYFVNVARKLFWALERYI